MTRDTNENMSFSYQYQQAADAKAVFIFAHGAGADKEHPFMQQVTELFIKKGVSVVRFNFPYMDKRALLNKKYPPDRMPKLALCYQDVLDQLRVILKPADLKLPLYIGGKSMGSRVAVTIASRTYENLQGIICFGYPFHPIKKPENLRLSPLEETSYPVLILQGERDALGNKEEIESYQLKTHCQMYYLPDGDHDLKPRGKSGHSHEGNIKQAITQALRFIDEH